LSVDDRNVFQIYMSDDGQIAPRLLACMQSIEDGTPGYRYRRYDEAALRAFLREHFPPAVLSAFDTLRPYSYKADLGRFSLLHQFGGWYVDAAVMLNTELPDTQGYDHVFFKDAPRTDLRPHDPSTSLFYARPGSKVLAKAIELIVQNCERRDYGEGPLDPTGPGLLGRAVEAAASDMHALMGKYMVLTPDHPRKNYAFVLPDGSILAWGKVTHGTPAFDGLRAFGAKGTNSYNILWQRGLVYAQPNPAKRCLESVSHRVRTFARRVAAKLRST
jgi:hypothetical protein